MEDIKRDLKAVNEFKKQMLRNLGDNADKKHWLECSYGYLFSRLLDEVEELREVLFSETIPHKYKKVMLESADVGNFAMMIADKARMGKIY